MKTLKAIEIDHQSTTYFLILPVALMLLLTNALIVYVQNTATDSVI